MSHNGDMYPTGQPLDHEPSMGQVPIVPPGTPPGDTWVPHFNGFMGRRSPNVPMGQPPMMPSDTMAMMGGPNGLGPQRLLPNDINDNDQAYPDYTQNTQNQCEVY